MMSDFRNRHELDSARNRSATHKLMSVHLKKKCERWPRIYNDKLCEITTV